MDTAGNVLCPFCGMLQGHQVMCPNYKEVGLNLPAMGACGRFLHSCKIEQDWEKECRDAWVKFVVAAYNRMDTESIYAAARGADELLKLFEDRFKPEKEK